MGHYNHQFLVLQTEGGYGVFEDELPIVMNGTEDYTFSIWMYKDTENNDYGELVAQENTFRFYVNGNAVVCQMEGYPLVETRPVLVSKRWIHLAISYKNIGFLKVYVNGELIQAASINGAGTGKGGSCVFGDSFYGFIRSVRFYREALTDEEITKEMNFPEEVKKSLVASFAFNKINPVEELSGKKITLTEDCHMALAAPCARFEQGSCAWIMQNEDINPGGNFRSYTIQTWLYLKPTMDAFQTIFENFPKEFPYGMSLFVERKGQEYYARFLHGSIKNKENLLESSTGLTMKTWINLAVVYDGNICTLYVNGEKDCQNRNLQEIWEYDRNANLRIGSDSTIGNVQGENWFRGAMSRLEVWNRALSQEEIQRYLSNQPDSFSEGLQAEIDFMSAPPADIACGRSIGFVQLLTGSQITEKATVDFVEDIGDSLHTPHRVRKVTEKETQLYKLRKEQTLMQLRSYLQEGIKKDIEYNNEQDCPIDITMFYQNLQALTEKMEQGEFIPTQILRENTEDGGLNICVWEKDEVWLAFHYTKEELQEMTPFQLWCIELILIILLGIINIIFCVKPRSVENIRAFVREQCINHELIKYIMNLTGGVTLKGIGQVTSYFTKNKLWSVVIRLLFKGMGSWLIIRAITLLISLAATGTLWIRIGGAVSLMAEVVYHLTHMPEEQAISLHQISFSAESASVELRKSAAEKIMSPQWKQNNSQPFAYSLKRLHETKCAIIFVKIAVVKEGKYYIRVVSDTKAGILGEIAPVEVEIRKDQDGFCDVKLTATRLNLENKGFGKEHFCWTWQYSNDGKKYEDFAQTEHDVYLIPEEPSAPWNVQTGIWVDALDAVLKYAGAQTGYDLSAKRRLIEKIARYLYTADGFVYDISRQKSSYTKGNICYLSKYLRDRSNTVTTHTVNSRDQAALLVAFGNMVGCNLTAKQVRENGSFYVNICPAIPVGSSSVKDKFTKVYKYEVACEDEPENGQTIVTDTSMKLDFGRSGEMDDYYLALNIPFSGEKGKTFIQSFAKNPEKCTLEVMDGKYGNGKRTIK